MGRLVITDLCKQYKDNKVVKQLSLTIEQGELVSLLGPSGCGKTTTLRMVAGLLEPTSGSIKLDEKEIVNTPTHKRDIGLVFQNYALFPHLTIYENVAYGLKRKKVNKDEVRKRVEDALKSVQLTGFEDRFPTQLSGGQQQRVALARSLVLNPAIILFDEPLSNLDAKLRQFLRVEIRQLQKKHGFTALFVTHDQEEAMVLSDRIAVMYNGDISQLGTPTEIYNEPSNSFVANFIGETNMIAVEDAQEESNHFTAKLKTGETIKAIKRKDSAYKEHLIMFRPEHAQVIKQSVFENKDEQNVLKGQVEYMHFKGSTFTLGVKSDAHDKTIICSLQPDDCSSSTFNEGDDVFVIWNKENTYIY
ncbi:ABC transporter ATP-binding protein [Sporosarcina obsidiansis]|uniref:ABC transporter ATP-binding protein n=1 Tax=Sporosarcina obsidiansis TaxID=2660748 RepID=UPI00129AF61F|nr:ABC transporter ATP-binding protein [Sporosarcina obsidiansis]